MPLRLLVSLIISFVLVASPLVATAQVRQPATQPGQATTRPTQATTAPDQLQERLVERWTHILASEYSLKAALRNTLGEQGIENLAAEPLPSGQRLAWGLVLAGGSPDEEWGASCLKLETKELLASREKAKSLYRQAIQKNPDAVKAIAKADDMAKRLETDELRKSREAVKAAIAPPTPSARRP